MSRIVDHRRRGFLGSHPLPALPRAGRRGRRGRQPQYGSTREHRRARVATPPSSSCVADVSHELPVDGPVDGVLHFASPASPPEYLEMPLETMDVGSLGTRDALDLARAQRRALPAGVDERDLRRPARAPAARGLQRQRRPDRPARGVRRSEAVRRDADDDVPPALRRATPRSCGSSTRTVRACGRPTVGSSRTSSCRRSKASRSRSTATASQTRSFCYVDDEVRGIVALFDSDVVEPVNIGNPDEFTMLELADVVREVDRLGRPRSCSSRCPCGDPTQRQPDITRARELLGWEPQIALREGLARMHDWYEEERARGRA